MPLWWKCSAFVFAALAAVAFVAGWLRLSGAAVGPLMAATAIVSMAAAYRLFWSRRLSRIVSGARRFAGGDREFRIGMKGDDELARTAQLLDAMAAELAATQIGLEAQVRERTADLRAVLAEVHERSRLAEEVNERLAEADRRRTRFLTNVSHDLRTPLNAILGYLKLLLDGVYEGDEERVEFLENARMSATHLQTLVHDVLAMTQVEEGKLKLRPEAIRPGNLVHEVLRMLEVDRRDRDLDLRFEIEGDIEVWADRARVMQVLVNLVANAIRFTPEGEVAVAVRRDGDFAVFDVRDTGVGIPPDQLEAVFERFHQVDRVDDEWGGGTGLGLAICRDLVQRMGGRIQAHSAGPGTGSVFTFTLPLAAVPVVASGDPV